MQLRTSVPRIARIQIGADSLCEVFSNGYAVYDNGDRKTVLWVPDCGTYTYYFGQLRDNEKQYLKEMEVLDMDPAYADRELNVGFSGGEKKKAEILQLLVLRPKLAILDETDSGLDVDAVKTVSAGIKAYKETTGGSLLIITHNTKILDSLSVDRVHLIADGRIAAEGGAELIGDITENGFGKYIGQVAE